MTAVTLPGHETEAARTALRAAIDELTTAKVLDVEHDDGSFSTTVVTPLLTQLANEINGMEPGGSFTARSRPPLRLDAMQLLTDIDRQVGARGTCERVAKVHDWGYSVSSLGTGHHVQAAAETVTGWLASVRELLNPTPKRRLSVPCPACGAVKVWSHRDEDNNESYARPALAIDEPSASCLCSACGARWGIELWEHLAAVLEQQREETLAVESYQPGSDVARLRLPAEPVQCSGRVRDPRADGYKTRRCTALLDEHGACRLREHHEPTGED